MKTFLSLSGILICFAGGFIVSRSFRRGRFQELVTGSLLWPLGMSVVYLSSKLP